MSESELNRLADIAREAGEFDLADKLDREASDKAREAAEYRWNYHRDNDTLDLY